MWKRDFFVAVILTAFAGGFGAAEPCDSYEGTPIFCEDFDRYCDPPPSGSQTCDPAAPPDNAAFHSLWPADTACAPASTQDYLLSGTEVRGSDGSLCVQYGPRWRRGTADYVYRHVHDMTPEILAHPDNTAGAGAVNGAGPIDQPISPGGVPPGYVDSMSSALRPQALKGTFYFHPLDGVNRAGLANMIYYHELFLDDDRAPMDFTSTLCTGDHFAHDCNCSELNQDATCSTGSCEGAPACVGECGFYECLGTCDGGPNDGQACTSDSDCSQCVGGPSGGQACLYPGDPVCKACDSGPHQGESCTSDAACGSGTCATGPRLGEACQQDADCGECAGGHRPGATCDEDWDCQWACGPGEQPVCEGGVNSGMACAQDSECEGTRFPVLNRTDNDVHASFAVGLMSIYDTNPCDSDQGYFPSEWRLVVFDGKTWQSFKAPLFDIPLTSPADLMDLYPLYGWNRIDFAIGSDYIEVRLTNVQSEALHSGVGACIFHTCKGGSKHGSRCDTDADCLPAGESMIPNPYLVARVPRQYPGPFNRYALGPAAGRDVTDPQSPGPEECMPALSSSDIISDEIILYDGVFASPNGACCVAGICSEIRESECLGLDGEFHGIGTPCSGTECCPFPFADADRDGDVDHRDFAAFQRCLSGTTGIAPPACRCFNRDGDSDVDGNDLVDFIECATGPGVPFGSSPTPLCVP